jgi:ribonuclease P protein component
MLPKKLRLPVQSFSSSAKIFFRGQYLVAKLAPNNLSYNRVGVVVGRKAAAKATQRNLIKRKVFNFFRANPDLLRTEDGGHDFLIIAQPALKGRRRGAIEAMVAELESIKSLLTKTPPRLKTKTKKNGNNL